MSEHSKLILLGVCAHVRAHMIICAHACVQVLEHAGMLCVDGIHIPASLEGGRGCCLRSFGAGTVWWRESAGTLWAAARDGRVLFKSFLNCNKTVQYNICGKKNNYVFSYKTFLKISMQFVLHNSLVVLLVLVLLTLKPKTFSKLLCVIHKVECVTMIEMFLLHCIILHQPLPSVALK